MARETKQSQIIKFIDEVNPTPKELQLFCKLGSHQPWLYEVTRDIVVDLCKSETYKELGIRGYYCTNILQWKRNFNVEVVDGRYQLTDNFKNHGGTTLYTKTDYALFLNQKKVTKSYKKRMNEVAKELTEALEFIEEMKYFVSNNEASEYLRAKIIVDAEDHINNLGWLGRYCLRSNTHHRR